VFDSVFLLHILDIFPHKAFIAYLYRIIFGKYTLLFSLLFHQSIDFLL